MLQAVDNYCIHMLLVIIYAILVRLSMYIHLSDRVLLFTLTFYIKFATVNFLLTLWFKFNSSTKCWIQMLYYLIVYAVTVYSNLLL